jgi:hypothetical protein
LDALPELVLQSLEMAPGTAQQAGGVRCRDWPVAVARSWPGGGGSSMLAAAGEVSRLRMTMWTEESEVCRPAVGEVAVDVVDVQDQRQAVPHWTLTTHGTHVRHSHLEQRRCEPGPRWSIPVRCANGQYLTGCQPLGRPTRGRPAGEMGRVKTQFRDAAFDVAVSTAGLADL